jgi:hypothetical protein
MDALPKSAIDRFNQYVDRGDANECWLWKGAATSRGYGSLCVTFRGEKSKYVAAHRVALFLATKQWGEVAMHSCDTPLCCNPSHLRWGTHAENVADRVRKGRSARTGVRGERHHLSKLSDRDVKKIRTLSRKRSIAELSIEYETPYQTIYNIVRGITRRDI